MQKGEPMDDSISRQAAIDAHCELCEDKGLCGDICPDVEVFRLIPSAQPEITDEQAIEHLQSTGWMQNHDREMYESGLREQLADDSGAYDSLVSCEDAISRQAAIDELYKMLHDCFWADDEELDAVITTLNDLPSVQPTLYGYDIKHLMLIAEVMRKENLPPERVTEALMDIGRIVSIVRDEFEETLREAMKQCKI
jgi:hypothetical protein